MYYLTEPCTWYLIISMALSVVFVISEKHKDGDLTFVSKSVASVWSLLSFSIAGALFMGGYDIQSSAAIYVTSVVTLSISSCCVYMAG